MKMASPAKKVVQRKAPLQGTDYQTMMLMLFAQIGYDLNKDKGYEIELGDDRTDAASFDDIVFNYTEPNYEKKRLFIQVKHSKKEITASRLLMKTKNPFQLIRYFCSYIIIKQSYSSPEYCVIATNTVFSTKLYSKEYNVRFSLQEKEYSSLHSILNVGGRFYTFVKTGLLEKLKENFIKHYYDVKDQNKKKHRIIIETLGSLVENNEHFLKELDNFLNILVFATNLPEGETLNEIIENRIGKEFLSQDKRIGDNFYREIWDYRKNKDLLEKFLTVEDINNIFKNNKHAIEAIRLASGYYFKLRDLNINFETNIKSHIKLKEFLNNNNEHTFIIITKHLFLCAIIMCQMIEDLRKLDDERELVKYKYDDMFRFFTLDKLVTNEKLSKKVKKSFTESWNLLVIITHTNTNENSKELFSELEKIIKTASIKKKVIVITSENCNLEYCNLFQSDKCRDVQIPNIKFSDLTHESKVHVLNKIVEFQGEKLTLSELFGCKDDFSELKLQTDALELIIKDNKIKIEKPVTLDYLEGTFQNCSDTILIGKLVDALSQCADSKTRFLISGVSKTRTEDVYETLFELLGLNNDIRKKTLVENQICLFSKINRENKRILVETYDKVNEKQFQKYCKVYPKEITYWINWENIEFKLQQIYKPHFYIKRKFCQKKKIISKTIKKYLLSTNSSDLFIFRGKSKEDLINLLNISKREEKGFKTLIENKTILINPDENSENIQDYENVYEFAIVNDDIILLGYSSGSLSKLDKYVAKPPDPKEENDFFANVQTEKLTILVNGPGMGKSTTLTSLSGKCVNTHWVILTHLKDCKEVIEDLPDVITIEEVVKFLCKVKQFSHLTRDLAAHVLKHHGSSRPLLILFDGFDEIKSGEEVYKRKVISLLKFLKDKTTTIVWVTSRNYELKTLQNGLSYFTTELENFKINDQKAYLEMHWKPLLALTLDGEVLSKVFGSHNENHGTKFDLASGALLNRMKTVSISTGQEEFSMVPLMLFLLAENFQDEFKMFVNCENNDISSFENFNILTIYEKFVRAQYKMYFIQQKDYKTNSDDEMSIWVSTALTKRYQKLAIKELFSDTITQDLQIDVGEKERDECFKGGLIQINEQQNIMFNHLTFAEYFVAQYFAHMLGKKKINPNKYRKAGQFLMTQIFKRKYAGLKFFLEEILKTNQDMFKEWDFWCAGNLLMNIEEKNNFETLDLDSLNKRFVLRVSKNKSIEEKYQTRIPVVEKIFNNFFCSLENLNKNEVDMVFDEKMSKKNLDSFYHLMLEKYPGITITPNVATVVNSLYTNLDVSSNNKDVQWLKTTGVCISKALMVLTSEMSYKFCSVLDFSVRKGKVLRSLDSYASKIFNLITFFLSFLHNNNNNTCGINLSALLDMFQCVVIKTDKKLTLNNLELESLVKCIVEALNQRFSFDLSVGVLSLIRLETWNIKIFSFEYKLVIIDSENDIQVQFQDEFYKKEIDELIHLYYDNLQSFNAKCTEVADSSTNKSVKLLKSLSY